MDRLSLFLHECLKNGKISIFAYGSSWFFCPIKSCHVWYLGFFFFFNPFVYPCNSKYWHMSETVIKKTAPTITKWVSEEFKAVGQVDSGQRHHSVCSVVLIPILFQCA